MAEINLTQGEADRLMAMQKRAIRQTSQLFPSPGDHLVVELASLDNRENFLLDVTRAQIRLTKATFQNRVRVAIVLFRLDVDGPPHRNPDGEEIACPHLHVYREGFGVKWAVAAPTSRFPKTLDLFSTLYAFMEYCNITELPRIDKGLFS